MAHMLPKSRGSGRGALSLPYTLLQKGLGMAAAKLNGMKLEEGKN